MIYHDSDPLFGRCRRFAQANRKISGSAHAHSVVQRFVLFMTFLVIWEANFCQLIPRFDKSMIFGSSMGFCVHFAQCNVIKKTKLWTWGRARGRMGRMGRMELGLVGCEEVIKFMEGSEENKSESSERTSPQAAKATQLSSTATATNPSAGVSEMSTDYMSVHKHRQQCSLQ